MRSRAVGFEKTMRPRAVAARGVGGLADMLTMWASPVVVMCVSVCGDEEEGG